MKVIQTIQHGGNEPVDIKFYDGDDLPSALAALVTASVSHAPHPYYNTLSVRIDF